MSIVGYSIGTKSKPNTTEEFYFWVVPEDKSVAIGSVVKLSSEENTAYGIVEEMESYSEAEDHHVHAFSRGYDPLLATPNREASIIVCKARIIKQLKERPIREGVVLYPTREELEKLFNQEECNIPFGVFINTDNTACAVRVNEEYVLGYEGAHVNISGMSGLGTKTSTFLFLLSSIFAHARARVACIIFNIKSDDLLYIDQPTQALEQEDREIYSLLGIEPEPFNARFFAPASLSGEPNSLKKDAEVFRWGYKEVEEFIPGLLTAGSEDQRDKLETAWYQLKRSARAQGLRSFAQILSLLEEIVSSGNRGSELVDGSYRATWGKLYNILRGAIGKSEGLLTLSEASAEIPYEEIGNREVFVIDLQKLSFFPRKLVFEKVITEFVRRLEEKKLKVDRLIIFMDELNKYAPPNASREVASLKEKLIDIAARGRSIGVSLFSAQQFKSKVDANILGNVSTDIYGKTKQSELEESIYSKFPREIKGRMRRFSRGEKLLDHELFETPLFVRVPRPPCMLGSERAKLRVAVNLI